MLLIAGYIDFYDQNMNVAYACKTHCRNAGVLWMVELLFVFFLAWSLISENPEYIYKVTFSLRGVLTFVASGLDINGCVLSYFEGTENVHCYTNCTLLLYIVAKCHFFRVVT